MVELNQYKLTKLPFLAIPAIRIDSSDTRANGRLFCREIAEPQISVAEQLILTGEFPMIFLRTEEAVLGNGKSAFMAAAYWSIYDKGKNSLWAEATTNPNIRDLLSKILDSIVLLMVFVILSGPVTLCSAAESSSSSSKSGSSAKSSDSSSKKDSNKKSDSSSKQSSGRGARAGGCRGSSSK